MPQIQGNKDEALFVNCKFLITTEMGYHGLVRLGGGLSRRVNKIGFFLINLYLKAPFNESMKLLILMKSTSNKPC